MKAAQAYPAQSFPASLFATALPRPWAWDVALWLAFRWLVVGCQAATLLITWPLWQVRENAADGPPMAPLLDLPRVDLGVALIASLAVVLVAPKPGFALHVLLLLYAAAIDQTRLQPEVVSLAFLMWGTLPGSTGKAFARAHLVSMWFFAGFNKLFSPGFGDGTAQWMVTGLTDDPPRWLYENAGWIIGGTELTIGILAFVPWTRKLAALAAVGLHAGILLDLSPRGHDWNEAVWPWNVALAFAGLALIWPWTESPRRWFGSLTPALRPLILLLLISPLGFYAGVTDAYLAHNLYSSNTASASVRCEDGCEPYQQPDATWDAFNVPLPPEHRIFKTYFRESCEPGDVLTIRDTRWWFRERDKDVVRIQCPAST